LNHENELDAFTKYSKYYRNPNGAPIAQAPVRADVYTAAAGDR